MTRSEPLTQAEGVQYADRTLMDSGGLEGARGRAVVSALLLGLCSGAVFWGFYRVFTVKFPLNFVSPVYASAPLFGIPFGLVWARHMRAASLRITACLGSGIILFAVCALSYKDKSVHYLLFGSYYNYPAPTSVWVTRGLLASVVLSVLPFTIVSYKWARLPSAARRFTGPALVLGVGGGVLLAEWLTPIAGAYAIFIVACAGCAGFLPAWRVGLATALGVVVAGVVMYHPPEAIFTWQLREYTRLDTYWSHHYKVDWIDFDGGHCLGAVRNEIMIGYSCDAPEKLELTHLKMAEVISNGPIRRERVASIGRADGVIAAAHVAKNPHLKRFVAAENDQRVVQDMLIRYTHQQGEIFTAHPGIELVGGDERLWLQRTREKFDAVYLDGIGLMLVPFPFTVIQQENYLFSADAYRRIFDDLLTPDGILIVDRGTTHSGESQDLAAALPEGVQVRTLFTKVPTYPLTGLPLVYVIASRNGAELDRIARELSQGNLYGQDTYAPAEARRRWSSDDRPMYQPKAIYGMFAVMAPCALITVAFVLWQLKRQVGTWARRDVWWELLLGIVFAVSAIWLTARGGRAFVAGTQMGFAYSCATMFVGIACGLTGARLRTQKGTMLGALVSCAVAFGVQLAYPLTPWAAVVACFVGGLGLGALAATARSLARSAPDGFEFILGTLLGIYVFQVSLFFAGFKLLAVCISAILALRSVRLHSMPVASHATPPGNSFATEALPVGGHL